MGSVRTTAGSLPRWEAGTGRYISSELRPRLVREGERSLVEALARAVDDRDLGALAALSAREKRTLLAALDRNLEHRGRRSPDPRLVVALTGLLSPEILGDTSADARAAGPSR
ncbi:MAG: hypothetical protein L3K04_01170 [Thermoplasmata archaeon]|nr:hypothetical protein [Thermoplasmata archaeon]MCI4340775.1 hypothetical protein [Thermoplasmata archaeon]